MVLLPEKLNSIEKESLEKLIEIEEILKFINKCNEPGEFLDDEILVRLKEVSEKTYIDDAGEQQPFITEDELVNLSIRRGSITEKERRNDAGPCCSDLKNVKTNPLYQKTEEHPRFCRSPP